MQKPLIIAEGYDVSQALNDPQDNYDIASLIHDIGNTKIDGYDFNDALDNGGYDLVFVDYDNGTDDIKKNAALVEEVIREVNERKTTTEQDVVMGISMGRLVARCFGRNDKE